MRKRRTEFVDKVFKTLFLERIITEILKFFVIREGKKFQILDEKVDISKIVPHQEEIYDRASLYIHIPFCKTLCPYCSFNRYLFQEDQAKKYFLNLKKELDLYIQQGFTFTNVYIGGGTPTIQMNALQTYVDYLKDNFAIKELSIETTPREISEESIEELRAMGVDRLSVGVQSFDREVVKSIGRLYVSRDLEEKLAIVGHKFNTLNLDFMFNFPTQTIENLKADLDILQTMKNDFDQVTFYPLMPAPHKKAALERKFNHVNTSREQEFYRLIQTTLLAEGYHPSTVWCFSKGNALIDEYIIEFDDYIGVGAGSVSKLNGAFYVNSFSLDNYGKYLNKNELPIVRWKKLTRHEQYRYYLITKLFGMRLDTSDFYHKFNRHINDEVFKELVFLKFCGLVKETNRIIQVTERGMYYVNLLMKNFYGALNALREDCITNQI